MIKHFISKHLLTVTVYVLYLVFCQQSTYCPDEVYLFLSEWTLYSLYIEFCVNIIQLRDSFPQWWKILLWWLK